MGHKRSEPAGPALDLDEVRNGGDPAATRPASSPSSHTGPPRPATWFRPDIDGLRAVAIMLVVLYHAQVPGFSGGFVGVDVFFVVSGYLITNRLIDETDTTGGVRLGRFWARRVRRLVPALALMVAVTLVASVFILARIDLSEVAHQGGAATLYVSNITFGRQAQDYFATSVSASPFLHTWSLGVEEQFYLVWPIVLALIAIAVSRRRRSLHHQAGRRRELVIVLLVMTAASFALNLLWSSQGSVWAGRDDHLTVPYLLGDDAGLALAQMDRSLVIDLDVAA